jgi:ATP-binding cassette subfamily F protein 3
MLSLEGVTRAIGARDLFEDVWWTIHPGERIGLVGPNGSGKTTLLRLIAGREEPDGGRVRRRRGLRVAYLPQEVEAEISGGTTVLEAALAGADAVREIGEELDRLAEEMERLSADPAARDQVERLAAEYGERRALFEWFGGDQLEARARVILGGLGFEPSRFQQPVAQLSGGWRMRVLMARLLLSGADLLLLDEPTNHLDLEALGWLEGHLASSPAAVVVVSHDRVFLDRVVEKIVDLVHTRLRLTTGGYSAWMAAREAEREQVERRDEQLAREEAHLRRFVERFGYKATKASQANERKKMLEKVRAERERLSADPAKRMRFTWPKAPPSPDLQVRLEGLRKAFGSHVVFDGLKLDVRRGDRWAVLGPNGAGKTTLLRLLSGELLPDAGRREFASGVTVGRFAQHQLEELDGKSSVFDEAAAAAPGRKPEEVRAALGAMGLDERHVDRPVETLSGGERARLALARLLLRPASLLMLDEPTNHLDLPLREALEEALAAWEGTVLVVSHDRAFLERVTDKALVVEHGGAREFDGGWREWLALEAAAPASGPAAPPPAAGPQHAQSRAGRRERAEALQRRSRRLKPLRERVQGLEAEISDCESALEGLDQRLADPEVHADGGRVAELAREREQLSRRLEALYPEWEETADALERAEAEEAM